MVNFFKKVLSGKKGKKDCCSIEIKEVKPAGNSCCPSAKESTESKGK